MRERLHARVRGRVQAVGFRAFLRHQADALGVVGWVRNRPDGSVEVVAEGDPSALEQFRRRLREGPPLAEVEDVEESRERATGEFGGFSIAPGV